MCSLSCLCKMVAWRLRKRKTKKGIVYRIYSNTWYGTLSERRGGLFRWNLMANYHWLLRRRLRVPLQFLVAVICIALCWNYFVVFCLIFQPFSLGAALADRWDQKSGLICCFQILSSAIWKHQPEAKPPPIQVLDLVVFLSSYLANSLLSAISDQHNCICRSSHGTATLSTEPSRMTVWYWSYWVINIQPSAGSLLLQPTVKEEISTSLLLSLPYFNLFFNREAWLGFCCGCF